MHFEALQVRNIPSLCCVFLCNRVSAVLFVVFYIHVVYNPLNLVLFFFFNLFPIPPSLASGLFLFT